MGMTLPVTCSWLFKYYSTSSMYLSCSTCWLLLCPILTTGSRTRNFHGTCMPSLICFSRQKQSEKHLDNWLDKHTSMKSSICICSTHSKPSTSLILKKKESHQRSLSQLTNSNIWYKVQSEELNKVVLDRRYWAIHHNLQRRSNLDFSACEIDLAN